MTIGKLATAGGVGVETVRYYQRRGLLAEPDRAGGVRRYDGDHLSRLRFIRSAQTAGFTLEEIRELLALDAAKDRERALDLANTRIAAPGCAAGRSRSAGSSCQRLRKHIIGAMPDHYCIRATGVRVSPT